MTRQTNAHNQNNAQSCRELFTVEELANGSIRDTLTGFCEGENGRKDLYQITVVRPSPGAKGNIHFAFAHQYDNRPEQKAFLGSIGSVPTLREKQLYIRQRSGRRSRTFGEVVIDMFPRVAESLIKFLEAQGMVKQQTGNHLFDEPRQALKSISTALRHTGDGQVQLKDANALTINIEMDVTIDEAKDDACKRKYSHFSAHASLDQRKTEGVYRLTKPLPRNASNLMEAIYVAEEIKCSAFHQCTPEFRGIGIGIVFDKLRTRHSIDEETEDYLASLREEDKQPTSSEQPPAVRDGNV